MMRGDIYLAPFPFGGTVGVKARPVLALTGSLGTVPEVLVAYITSIIPASLLATDIVLDPMLPEFTGTNLRMRSLLRLHKLGTLHESSMMRHLGAISPTTQAQVDAKLKLLLNL